MKPKSRLRQAVSIIFTLAALVMFALAAQAAISYGAVNHTKTLHTERYVVHHGDTLWTIATRMDPSQDPRKVVRQIEQLNGISDQTVLIQPGEVIDVPVTGGK